MTYFAYFFVRVNYFPFTVSYKISYFSFFLIRRRFMRIPCLFWTCSDWDERVRTLLSSKDDIFCSRGHCSLRCDENQLLRPRRGLFIFEAAAVLASSTRFQPRPRPRMHAARVHTLSLCSPCKDLPPTSPQAPLEAGLTNKTIPIPKTNKHIIKMNNH